MSRNRINFFMKLIFELCIFVAAIPTNTNNYAPPVPFAEVIPIGRATGSQNRNAQNGRVQLRTQNTSPTPTNRPNVETPIPVAEGIPVEVEMVSQNGNARNGLVPLYSQDGSLLGHDSQARLGNGAQVLTANSVANAFRQARRDSRRNVPSSRIASRNVAAATAIPVSQRPGRNRQGPTAPQIRPMERVQGSEREIDPEDANCWVIAGKQGAKNISPRPIPIAEAIPIGRNTVSQNRNVLSERVPLYAQHGSLIPTSGNNDVPIPEAEGTLIEVETTSQNRNARNDRIPLYAQDGILIAHVSRAQVGNSTQCLPAAVVTEILQQSGRGA